MEDNTRDYHRPSNQPERPFPGEENILSGERSKEKEFYNKL
jgi:hypothetical protein